MARDIFPRTRYELDDVYIVDAGGIDASEQRREKGKRENMASSKQHKSPFPSSGKLIQESQSHFGEFEGMAPAKSFDRCGIIG